MRVLALVYGHCSTCPLFMLREAGLYAFMFLLGGAVTLVLLIILIFKMRRDAKSLP